MIGKNLMRLSVAVILVGGILSNKKTDSDIGFVIGMLGVLGWLAGCIIRWKEESPERKKRVEGWEIAKVRLAGEPEAKVKGGVLFVSFVTWIPLDCLTSNIIKKEVQKFTITYVNGKEEIKKCKVGSDEYYALMARVDLD